MFPQTIKFSAALAALCLSSLVSAQAPVSQQPATATSTTPNFSPASEPARFQMPQNIAESAEAARRDAAKKLQEESSPPKSAGAGADRIDLQRPGPGMQAAALAPAPAPKIVQPFQDMRLVALLDVDGKRLAGLHINGNTNYVVIGASIGNGWQVQSIDGASVVVVQSDSFPGAAKRSKSASVAQPKVQTLMLDAMSNSATRQGASPSNLMPTPMPFR